MEERLNAKLKYLYEMLKKYNDLNEKIKIFIYGDKIQFKNKLRHLKS